jgi:SAM-dependent methyltransferase
MSRKIWDEMSFLEWQDIRFPWRPLPSDEPHLFKAISELNKFDFSKKVAVLGSTPELRNTLFQHNKSKSNFKVDVIDQSSEMYLKMSQVFKTDFKENFIHSDWIEYFSQRSKKYDLIAGDLVLRVLDNNYLQKLINEAGQALNSGGYLLLRVYSKPSKKSALRSIFRILKAHRCGLLSAKSANPILFFLFSSFIDEKSSFLRIKPYVEFIKNKISFEKDSDLIDGFINQYEHIPFVFHERTEQEIFTLLSHKFKLSSYKNSHSKWIETPIVVWQKL